MNMKQSSLMYCLPNSLCISFFNKSCYDAGSQNRWIRLKFEIWHQKSRWFQIAARELKFGMAIGMCESDSVSKFEQNPFIGSIFTGFWSFARKFFWHASKTLVTRWKKWPGKGQIMSSEVIRGHQSPLGSSGRAEEIIWSAVGSVFDVFWWSFGRCMIM